MSAALFSKDILDFLALLRKHNVRYLVVGGEAVIQYGYARFTADMDLFYDNAEPNVERLYQALLEFWGGSVPGIESSRNLRATGKIFPFGSPPDQLPKGFPAPLVLHDVGPRDRKRHDEDEGAVHPRRGGRER